MKLRFEVNQAEAFRRGIDCPESVVMIEVEPAKVPQAERNLIADRMRGIDVVQMDGKRVVAQLATLESLIEAIRLEETVK